MMRRKLGSAAETANTTMTARYEAVYAAMLGAARRPLLDAAE